MWEIYSFLALGWWLKLVWFLIAIIFSWFLPGLVLLRETKISDRLKFFVAPILGISLWAIQGYLFGWLNLRWLSYVYVGVFTCWFGWQRQKLDIRQYFSKLSSSIWLILLFGVVMQLVPVFGSGWRSSEGIKYYFVNVFDGVFHLSLERALVDHVPPFQPGANDLLMTNYHYLADLVLADLARVWVLPINHVYFQYLPLFMSIWFGFSLITLLKQWSDNQWVIGTGLVLFYGVGELSWLINIWLGNNSLVPFEVFVDHGVLQFLNQPQAFAKFILFGCLILWHEFWQKKSVLLGTIIGLMSATLIGFKVYFGLAGFLGLGLVASYFLIGELIKLIKSRNLAQWQNIFLQLWPIILMGLAATILAIAIYWPTNSAAGGIFFDFLTWPKLLLGASKLNWNEWWLRLQVYEAAGNIKALIVWYALAAGIFGLAIYHLRILGMMLVLPGFRGKLTNYEVWFILPTAVIFGLIGMNFLQTSGGANSFNFTVVAVTLFNLLTALAVGKITSSNFGKFLVGICLMASMVQTGFLQYYYFRNYSLGYDSQAITPAHEAGLKYLSLQNNQTTLIQTFPNHYLDSTTPYSYFFTGQKSYLSGKGILESHNQPIKNRVKLVTELFDADPWHSALIANEVKISHLLLSLDQNREKQFALQAAISATNSAMPGWRTAYSNSEIVILSRYIPANWPLELTQ